MKTELAKRQPDQLAAIDEATEKYKLAAISGLSNFAQAMQLAEGLAHLKDLVKPLLPKLKTLAGSPLGFRTDKQYGDDQIVEAITEAVLRGVRPLGNEFNIIAGRCYITKEGYTRLVAEIDGLTDLVMIPGVPAMKEGGTIVRFHAEYKRHGEKRSYDRDIAVRLNSGQGVDAAIGKATRKMLAWIHGTETQTNLSITDASTEVDEFGEVKTKTEKVLDKLPSREPLRHDDEPPLPADGKLFDGSDDRSPPK